jgi:alanyl aminopeptidase
MGSAAWRSLSAALLLAPCAALGAAPPAGKLPRDVAPLHYALRLEIDPAAARYAGEVRIRVRVAKPTRTLWLHGRDLEIASASATPADAAPVALEVEPAHESGVLRLSAPEPLPAGVAELALAFRAPFGARLDGTYRVEVAGRSYVMTQLEPLAARASFPCFDEPAFKTPWDVTLVVPAGNVAVANARELRAEALPDGRRAHVFATTEPLPSYLVAYAVGPFDVVEGDPIPPTPQRLHPLPLRGLAVAGRGAELRFALAETARLVAVLETWFDLAYPFDKLDLLAAPDFAFGAMENAGLITYHERWLLIGERATTGARQGFFSVHLHELAHQWFGNLVTMPWWDDLWLNEAFATWLSNELLTALEPGFRFDLKQLEAVRWAMDEDSLASARRVAEPVDDYREVASAFDGITYQKGAAVLGMFEAYLGEQRFQAAIRAHLRAHARGTATSGDLVRALAREAEHPDAVAAALRSFLDQPGVPLVALESLCRDGRPSLAATQQRFLPLGSRAAPAGVWGVPLCVAHAAGGGEQTAGGGEQTAEGGEQTAEGGETAEGGRRTHCALLSAPRAELPVPGGSCDAWWMPNADGAGYYRFALPEQDRSRLDAAFAALKPREQLLLGDALAAGFERGALAPADVLRGAERIAAAPDWPVAGTPLPTVAWLREQLASPPERAALDAWIRRLYGPRLAALGLDERDGEPDDALLERAALVETLARAGDPALRRELLARARAAFETGRFASARLAANQRAGALVVLAQDGSDADFAALESALRSEADAQVRRDLLRALGAARAPQRGARARALALDAAVRAGELFVLLGSHFEWEENRGAGRAWFLAHEDALFAKLPALHAAGAPALWAGGACSEAEAALVEERFGARLAALEGGPRALAELAERIRLCATLRAHQRPRGFGDALAEPRGPVL